MITASKFIFNGALKARKNGDILAFRVTMQLVVFGVVYIMLEHAIYLECFLYHLMIIRLEYYALFSLPKSL